MDTVSDSLGLKFLIAIVLVGLAMAGFFALVLVLRRRFPGGIFGAVPSFRGASFLGGSRGRRDRIRVIETIQVDPRRRAILIRRDNVEHLVLVGGPTDVVIETGIDAPYEAAEPEEEYGYDFQEEEAYEPPAPPRRPAVQPRTEAARAPDRAAPLGYQEWDDELDDERMASGQYLKPRVSQPSYEQSPGEPPPGTIRPVTLSRGIRPISPSAREEQSSAEEAALARELEAARRRTQAPAPRSSPPSSPANEDFDDILAREMEERLEAAKRQARGQPSEAPRRDPNLPRITGASPDPQRSTMQAGLARIFGDTGRNNEG